jgi:preprotein translocase subunit SecG
MKKNKLSRVTLVLIGLMLLLALAAGPMASGVADLVEQPRLLCPASDGGTG